MAKKKESKLKPYQIAFTVNGVNYFSDGDTPEQALLLLPKVDPKTKAIFTLTKEGVTSKPQYLNIRQFKMLTVENLTGQIQRAAIIKRLMV
jgi:hypothetical protein